MSAAVRSKQICRVVWFDQAGKFAKAPSKPTDGLKPKLSVRKSGGKVVKLEEGGTAVITRKGAAVAVRYIPDASIRRDVEAAKKRGDKAYLEGYQRWVKQVEKDLAADVLAKRRVAMGKKLSTAMEKSFNSEKSRKAAATQKAKKAALTPQQKARAKDQSKALGLRLKNLRGELAKAKTQKQKTTLRNRIRRLSKAQEQLEKISQGKAYKFPSPSQMR